MDMDLYKKRDDRISEVIKRHGGFFAFGNKQFHEQRKEGVVYVSMGLGLIAPKGTHIQLGKDLAEVSKDNIIFDLETNGKKKIIHRELANHEAQITISIDNTCDALEGYGITREEVQAEFSVYMDHCREHDLF